VNMEYRCNGNGRRKPKYPKKSMSQYYVPTRCPTRTGMGPNLSLHDKTLATNSLNYGTALSMVPSDRLLSSCPDTQFIVLMLTNLIRYCMIHLLTVIGLTPVVVVKYTFTHKQYTEQHNRHKQYEEPHNWHKQYEEQHN